MQNFFKLILIFVLGSPAFAGETQVNWEPPTENMDGSPLTDLAGYAVYWGDSEFVWTNSLDIPDPYATSFAVPMPDKNVGDVVFIVMKAYDLDGNYSIYSNQISATVQSIGDKANPSQGIIINIVCTPGRCN